LASPVGLTDFIRKFRHFGVDVKVKGSHILMRKTVDRASVLYVAAVHGKKVDPVYVAKARRRFKLLPADGVSDAEFDSA